LPDTTEQRRARREAAMRVLKELAAEETEAAQGSATAEK
jgi:hypothetical protein